LPAAKRGALAVAPVPAVVRAAVRACRPVAALALAAAALLSPSTVVARRAVAIDAPEPVPIEIGEGTYYYLPLRAGATLSFAIEGPAVFQPIMRWRFEADRRSAQVDVGFSLDGRAVLHRVFRSTPGGASYPEMPGARPGDAVRVAIDVPSGGHAVTMSLVSPGSGTLDVNPVVKDPSVLPWRLEWRGELGAAYDSNIFRYSDDEVDDFLDGRRQDRFPSDYLDDVRMEPSVDLMFIREEPRRRETEFRLSADYRLATVNRDKSFARLGTRVTESRDGIGYALIDYYTIPSYHIRDLWDPDVKTGSPYRPCDFRKNAVRMEAGTDRQLPLDLTAEIAYDRTGYGPDFVEYDSDAWTGGVTAVVRPANGLRIDAGYALRSSTARGYDEVGETRGSSDDSDISYEQDEYTLRARWAVGRVGDVPTVLVAGGRLARRFYQADGGAEDDPYHAGRDDTYWTLWVRNAWKLSRAATLEGFYVFRARTARSDIVDEIGTLKDYRSHRFGVRLILRGETFLD
jgi:hypothetical protein